MFETEKRANPVAPMDLKSPGRPEKIVDWKKVDRLLAADCKGTEIAAHFDMNPNTFYRKVEEEFNIGFTEYSAQKKGHGESLIRVKQFDKAVNDGDSTMLIWLGKNRLGQKDHRVDQTAPNHELLSVLLNEIKSLKGKLAEVEKIQTAENKQIENQPSPDTEAFCKAHGIGIASETSQS